MKILEERIVLAGVEFTRSEMLEIASHIIVGSDHSTFYLNTSGETKQEVKIYGEDKRLVSTQQHVVSKINLLRKSKAVQKALAAELFETQQMGKPLRLKAELSNAIVYFRGKKA